MARKQEIKEFGGKKFRLNEIPPLEAIKIGRRWLPSFDKDDGGEENVKLVEKVLTFVEVEISPDRWIKLDSAELVNQHTRATFIISLCEAELGLSFDFLNSGESSNS